MRALFSSFLLLIFFVGATTSYGKETLYPGYIITLKNDTVNGYIDYKNWDKNPDKILFKKTISDTGLYFTPELIIEFNIENEIYKSAIVEIDQSPFRTNDLTLSPEFQLITDTVFLRAVFIGEKELYFLKDSRGKDSFYIKDGSGYHWLMYKKYLKKEDKKKLLAVNNNYIGQLILYLQNCPTINPVLSSMAYSYKDFLKVFSYYYDFTKSEVIYQPNQEKVKLNFSVLAGVNITSLKFKSEAGVPYLTDVDYPISTNFTAGIALDILFPRNFGRWSFNNEVFYTSYSTKGSYENYTHENRYIITDTELSFSYIKINTMFRRNFPVQKMVIFTDLGFSNGFMITSHNYKKETNILFEQINITEGEAIPETRKHEQCLLVGFGGRYNHFSVGLRYEIGNGMSNYLNTRSTTHRFYFLFGYKF